MKAIAGFFLPCLVFFHASMSIAEDCPYFFQETFLQPTTSQSKWDDERWDSLFHDWQRLGIQRVVLQWSRYGDTSFHASTSPTEPETLISKLFKVAENNHIKLVLGLKYDPDFWERISGGLQHRSVYFEQRALERRLLIDELSELAKQDSFAGWYIADEIDDLNWRGDERQEQLIAYLSRAVRQIRQSSEAPISISAFSNGKLPSEQWGDFWNDVLNASGIEQLYFQDGLGVDKLNREELALYLDALKTALSASNKKLTVISELFRMRRESGFQSADLGWVKDNLSLVREIELEASAFAFHPYLDPKEGDAAKQLYEQYRNAQWLCTETRPQLESADLKELSQEDRQPRAGLSGAGPGPRNRNPE
ncbi:MAG: DUF4434 domain-containing protein [Pseudomonadota bacterium]